MAPVAGGPPRLDPHGDLSDAIALARLRVQRQAIQRQTIQRQTIYRQTVVERSLSVANGPQFSQRMT